MSQYHGYRLTWYWLFSNKISCSLTSLWKFLVHWFPWHWHTSDNFFFIYFPALTYLWKFLAHRKDLTIRQSPVHRLPWHSVTSNNSLFTDFPDNDLTVTIFCSQTSLTLTYQYQFPVHRFSWHWLTSDNFLLTDFPDVFHLSIFSCSSSKTQFIFYCFTFYPWLKKKKKNLRDPVTNVPDHWILKTNPK